MKKRIIISLCSLILWGSHAEAKPPNIVLILSDDQSYTDYSFMGHAQIETPHLDKLASESALFRRGYVPTALCRPALMTLATGLYFHQHLTTGNNPARTAANAAHAKKAGEDILELLISRRQVTQKANAMISQLAEGEQVHYLDIGSKFMDDDGVLTRGMMPDRLHLNSEGYAIWAESIEATLSKLLGESSSPHQ